MIGLKDGGLDTKEEEMGLSSLVLDRAARNWSWMSTEGQEGILFFRLAWSPLGSDIRDAPFDER